MDSKLEQIAAMCFSSSQSGSMSFPEIVAVLSQAGFESFTVDFRQTQATYYLPNNDSVGFQALALGGAIATTFDKRAVELAIREAQHNAADYTYLGFCAKVRAAGCAGYIVSFLGRRVVYYGRTAELHVEPFP